jgi:hypothetical protein
MRYPIDLRASQMSSFLSGEAREWYIAPNVEDWTVEKIGTALFDFFFSTQLRGMFRKEFNEAKQEGKIFKHFVQGVKNLAVRVPDVNERHIIIRIWFGANGYLRQKWSDIGLDPELSSLEEIEITGERFEISAGNSKALNGVRTRMPFNRGRSMNVYRGNVPRFPYNRLSSQAVTPAVQFRSPLNGMRGARGARGGLNRGRGWRGAANNRGPARFNQRPKSMKDKERDRLIITS